MPSRRVTIWLFAAAALIAAPLLGSCAAAADSAANGVTGDTGGPGPEFRPASIDLANRDIRSARAKYEEILRNQPGNGRAAAGKAVTELLLLPGSPSVVELLQNHLGARGGLDAQAVIYEESGYLDLLKKGATWEGRGSAGIKDVLAEKLPWDADELGSLSAFADGLDSPVGEARGDFLSIAERLAMIERHLQTALDDDDFERFVVPGETFRDLRLTLKLGKSELATIAAFVAGTRGVMHYLAAYKYRWTLQQAFTEQCEAYNGDPASDWAGWDCTVKFLDAQWFRAFEEVTTSDHLAASQSGFDDALEFAKEAIKSGMERRNEETDLTLDWDEVDAKYAERWLQFITDLRTSLGNPGTASALRYTVHPNTDTEARADFSVFFTEGRTLDPEIEWLVRADIETADGTPYWQVSDEAIQSYFVEDVFAEPFDVTQDQQLQLSTKLRGDDGKRLDTELDHLLGELETAIDNSYLSNR